MNNHDLVTALREGGQTQRAHTLPHHGSYSVAEHSWHATCLLLCLHPSPSANLLKAVLVHDVAERWTGDVPAFAKWADGELGKALDRLEARVNRTLGLGFMEELTPDERLWLRAVDAVELMLWAKEQVALGNLNAHAVIGNLASYFGRTKLPEPVVAFVNQHQWTRNSDTLPT